jgi:hypothetical protein
LNWKKKATIGSNKKLTENESGRNLFGYLQAI